MPEPRKALLPLAALGSGLALTVVAGLGGVAAAIGATLAQPAWALAVSGWRRRGDAQVVAGWRRDAWSLALLWLATVGLFAAVLAWPLSRLLATGSLPATDSVATMAAEGMDGNGARSCRERYADVRCRVHHH